MGALSITQLFDTVAIRLDGRRASATRASVRWEFSDTGEVYRMELSNGALVHFPTHRGDPADLTVTLTRGDLMRVLGSGSLDRVEFTGDADTLATILSLTDAPDASFPMVSP